MVGKLHLYLEAVFPNYDPFYYHNLWFFYLLDNQKVFYLQYKSIPE